jgi:hypothetical protein
VPGAADGRCGDWAQVATCLNCVAESAATSAVEDKYGLPSVPLPADAQECQHAIGYGLLHIMRTRIGEALGCQKKLDAGKATLASGITACKDSDPKAKIAAAQAKAADAVQLRCVGVDLFSLDGICGGVMTLPEIGQCVIDNAKALTEAFAFAVVPSSARRCGDDLQTGFEQCDGTDDDDCPGACTTDCTCATPLLPPVLEDLLPCQSGIFDRYRFPVVAGETVQISADVVDGPTAADLCLQGSCPGGTNFSFDNEVLCAGSLPGGYSCPNGSFNPLATGICSFQLTECEALPCGNPGQANYTLTVTRNGNPTPLFLVGDDDP